MLSSGPSLLGDESCSSSEDEGLKGKIMVKNHLTTMSNLYEDDSAKSFSLVSIKSVSHKESNSE